MAVGVTLTKDTSPYFSRPFPRGGETGIFAVDVMNLTGSATLDIDVRHKNSGDTSWSTAGSFAQITATGQVNHAQGGLKEMVRLAYTVGGSHGDMVHVFTYEPMWEPA